MLGDTELGASGPYKQKLHARHKFLTPSPSASFNGLNGPDSLYPSPLDSDRSLEEGNVGRNLMKVIELQSAKQSPLGVIQRIRSRVRISEYKEGIKEGSKISPRLKGLVLLNLVMLACASTFVVLKEGQADLDPFVFSTIRFFIAALAFAPFWRRALRDDRLVRGGIEIGIWAAGGYLTQSVAMVSADASRGAFLSGFTVVVVPLLAGMFGTTKLKPVTWASVLAALIGVSLLEESGAPASWGDFWSFASAVLFGIQIYRTEYWSKLCGGKNALPMMSVSLVIIAALSVLSMLMAHPHEMLLILHNPRAWEVWWSRSLPWAEILYMGLGVTNLGLWMEVVALQDVSSTEAAIIYTLEPVCGAAFAYWFLGERWGASGWLGACLIVFSCVLTQLLGAEEKHV